MYDFTATRVKRPSSTPEGAQRRWHGARGEAPHGASVHGINATTHRASHKRGRQVSKVASVARARLAQAERCKAYHIRDLGRRQRLWLSSGNGIANLAFWDYEVAGDDP